MLTIAVRFGRRRHGGWSISLHSCFSPFGGFVVMSGFSGRRGLVKIVGGRRDDVILAETYHHEFAMVVVEQRRRFDTGDLEVCKAEFKATHQQLAIAGNVYFLANDTGT